MLEKIKTNKIRLIAAGIITVSLAIVAPIFFDTDASEHGPAFLRDGDPSDFVEEFRKIPHVDAFYNHYSDSEILILPDSYKNYHVEFQALQNDYRAKLYVEYLEGEATTVRYYCDINSKEFTREILHIKDAKPGQITDCFE